MDTGFIAELACSLREYCQDKLNLSIENRLVKTAATIVQQKLWGRLKAAALANNSTPEGESLSLLAGLFAKSGHSSRLCEGLEDYLDGDEICLFLRFQTIVVRSVSQELFHRWRENDPLSAKLWRNLQRILRHDNKILIFPPDKPRWAMLSDQENKSATFEPVSYDNIRRLAGEHVTKREGLADIIVYVLKEAGDDPDQPNVVRIEDLFAGLREALAAFQATSLENSYKTDFDDPLLQMITDKALKTVRSNLDKIICRYKEKGRIETEIADLFGKSLRDLLDDYSNGGLSKSYYHYIHAHQPSLNREQYRSEYRTRFEYLAEYAQKDFIKAMKREYYE